MGDAPGAEQLDCCSHHPQPRGSAGLEPRQSPRLAPTPMLALEAKSNGMWPQIAFPARDKV